MSMYSVIVDHLISWCVNCVSFTWFCFSARSANFFLSYDSLAGVAFASPAFLSVCQSTMRYAALSTALANSSNGSLFTSSPYSVFTRVLIALLISFIDVIDCCDSSICAALSVAVFAGAARNSCLFAILFFAFVLSYASTKVRCFIVVSKFIFVSLLHLQFL